MITIKKLFNKKLKTKYQNIDRIRRHHLSMEESFLKFEFDIFKHFLDQHVSKKTQAQVLLSPYSIGICLSYISNLVNSDQTRHEIRKVLHCDNELKCSQFMTQIKSLESSVENEENQDILKTANILFTDIPSTELSEHEIGFLPDIVNFSIMCSTSSMINRTVKNRTNGRISRLTNPLINHSRSSFVMSSISLFECEWAEQYKSKFTVENHTFHGFNSSLVVPMLRLKDESVLFSFDKNCYSIELPFSKEEFSFFAMIPKKKSFKSFKKMIDSLNHEKFSYLLNSSKLTKTDLIIPKFTIETDPFNLITLMDDLNISHNLAFVSERQMSQFYQKCTFSFNEIGSIPDFSQDLVDSACLAKEKKTKSLKNSFNRPFAFFIIKHNPDIILLSGIISLPPTLQPLIE